MPGRPTSHERPKPDAVHCVGSGEARDTLKVGFNYTHPCEHDNHERAILPATRPASSSLIVAVSAFAQCQAARVTHQSLLLHPTHTVPVPPPCAPSLPPGPPAGARHGRYATTTPPTVTAILIGKGDMLDASVMRGTAARPRSDEAWASITCRLFVSVPASSALNFCRSARDGRQRVRAGFITLHLIS